MLAWWAELCQLLAASQFHLPDGWKRLAAVVSTDMQGGPERHLGPARRRGGSCGGSWSRGKKLLPEPRPGGHLPQPGTKRAAVSWRKWAQQRVTEEGKWRSQTGWHARLAHSIQAALISKVFSVSQFLHLRNGGPIIMIPSQDCYAFKAESWHPSHWGPGSYHSPHSGSRWLGYRQRLRGARCSHWH